MRTLGRTTQGAESRGQRVAVHKVTPLCYPCPQSCYAPAAPFALGKRIFQQTHAGTLFKSDLFAVRSDTPSICTHRLTPCSPHSLPAPDTHTHPQTLPNRRALLYPASPHRAERRGVAYSRARSRREETPAVPPRPRPQGVWRGRGGGGRKEGSPDSRWGRGCPVPPPTRSAGEKRPRASR